MIEHTRNALIELNTACQTLTKVGTVSAELASLHQKFNQSVKDHKWESMEEVYGTLHETTVTWGIMTIITREKPQKTDIIFTELLFQDVQLYSQRDRTIHRGKER